MNATNNTVIGSASAILSANVATLSTHALCAIAISAGKGADAEREILRRGEGAVQEYANRLTVWADDVLSRVPALPKSASEGEKGAHKALCAEAMAPVLSRYASITREAKRMSATYTVSKDGTIFSAVLLASVKSNGKGKRAKSVQPSTAAATAGRERDDAKRKNRELERTIAELRQQLATVTRERDRAVSDLAALRQSLGLASKPATRKPARRAVNA